MEFAIGVLASSGAEKEAGQACSDAFLPILRRKGGGGTAAHLC